MKSRNMCLLFQYGLFNIDTKPFTSSTLPAPQVQLNSSDIRTTNRGMYLLVYKWMYWIQIKLQMFQALNGKCNIPNI